MNYDLLETKAKSHSIEQVLLALEWSIGLSVEHLALLRTSARPSEHMYPREETQFSVNMTFDMGQGMPRPQPQQEVSGYSFSRFTPEGEMARQIQMTRQFCLFIANDYSNWAALLEEAHPVFDRILTTLPAGVGIGVIGLQYVDKFFWRGDLVDWSLDAILCSESRLVPPHMRTCRDQCHAHHGYFEQCTEPVPHRRLDNINVDVIDAGGDRVLQFLSSHKAILATPLTDDVTSQVKHIQTALKKVHRAVLTDLLQPTVLNRIGFGQPQNGVPA